MHAKYVRVFSIGLQDTFVYRWNFILRSLFGIVPLVGTVFIWQAIFDARGENVGSYDFREMVFYFLLVLLVENLVTPTEDEWRIAAEIRDGQISALLTKPLNYLWYRMSLFAGYRSLYNVATLPVVVVLFAIFHEYLRLPADPWTWPVFLFSVGLAALLQFFIAYSLAMMAFWILEISTIVFIFYSFEYFLSGQLFPLDVLPGWIQPFLKYSPFAYELFFPVQIYLERVRGAELAAGLFIQAGWVIFMWLVAQAMFRAGVRKYQAVGG